MKMMSKAEVARMSLISPIIGESTGSGMTVFIQRRAIKACLAFIEERTRASLVGAVEPASLAQARRYVGVASLKYLECVFGA